MQEILNNSDDFFFGALNIENHNKHSASNKRHWFEHLKENHNRIEGNIFEFGVYRGASIISMAILLKRLNSSKKIFGFDTFTGFPDYSEYDDSGNFEKYAGVYFDENILRRVRVLEQIRTSSYPSVTSDKEISGSNNFANTSLMGLKQKIDALELNNIVLIEGTFSDTVPKFFEQYKDKIFSTNIDCDLYKGYKTCLPYVWDNLLKGGYVHLDEYYSLRYPGARIACEQFFEERGLRPKMHTTPESEFERWYLIK